MTSKANVTLESSSNELPAGELVTGLAHDVNNLLGVVIGGLGYVQDELQSTGANPDCLEAIEDALSAGREAASLMLRAVAAVGVQPGRPERVDVAQLLGQIADDRRDTMSPSVRLLLPASPLAWAYADPQALDCALRELLDNAVEAVGEAGAITLACKLSTRGSEALRNLGLPAGKYLKVAIEDDGEGMTETVRQAADQPFFSTRGRGRHGMGLCVASGFARQNRGRLVLESEPSRGTRASLYLPSAG